jgi:hypothetical protein
VKPRRTGDGAPPDGLAAICGADRDRELPGTATVDCASVVSDDTRTIRNSGVFVKDAAWFFNYRE